MKDGLSGGKIETGRAVRCLALARGERMVAWVPGMLLNIVETLSGSGSIFVLEAACFANRLDVGRKEKTNQRGI